jgi:threonine dehydratase
MYIPLKAKITIGIIAGLTFGAAALAYGMAAQTMQPPVPTFMAIGAGGLIGGIAALVSHLTGGFRDIMDEDE